MLLTNQPLSFGLMLLRYVGIVFNLLCVPSFLRISISLFVYIFIHIYIYIYIYLYVYIPTHGEKLGGRLRDQCLVVCVEGHLGAFVTSTGCILPTWKPYFRCPFREPVVSTDILKKD